MAVAIAPRALESLSHSGCRAASRSTGQCASVSLLSTATTFHTAPRAIYTTLRRPGGRSASASAVTVAAFAGVGFGAVSRYWPYICRSMV